MSADCVAFDDASRDVDVTQVVDEIAAMAMHEVLKNESTSVPPQPSNVDNGAVKSPESSCRCVPNSSPTGTNSCVSSGTKTSRRSSKFRVRFADDEGKDLFAARECPPSDVPPDLDVKSILKEAYIPPTPFGALGLYAVRSNSTEKPPGKWAYTESTQPMDDYAAFARVVEEQYILAENVFLNNDKLICTIKIKCVKTVKRVFARITFNNWISFDDVDCNLIPLAGMAASQLTAILYKRYVFERVLPPVPPSNEPVICGGTIMFCFCVKFEDGEERWDNHFGRNYVVEVRPCDPDDDNAQPGTSPGDVPAFNIIAHHFGPAPVNDEEQRYKSQLRAMSPDYTFYNETSEFYW